MNKLFVIFLAFALPVGARAGDFALRDGDTVAFLGDSITAARDYTQVVELYTLMRFPDRRVRFVNAGQGGDTAEGSLRRIDRDVFDQGANVVLVIFGLNDIGWGVKADEEHKKRFLDSLRAIIGRCREKNARPVICSPAVTAELSTKSESGFLQKMTDEGLEVAKSLGAETIDIQRPMRAIQKRIETANAKQPDESKHTRLHLADGVHLNSLGHLAMAFAILKGLGAPAEVSSATIDAAALKATESQGCEVSRIEALPGGGLAFTRLDEGLPLNRGIFSAFDYLWVPIPAELNGYRLQVTGLAEGDYEIWAADRAVGTAKSASLARGINISSMTANGWQPGGPWDAQAGLVKELTAARDRVAVSEFLRSRFADAHPEKETLDRLTGEIDDRIVELQRATARPYPYRFEIRPAAAKK